MAADEDGRVSTSKKALFFTIGSLLNALIMIIPQLAKNPETRKPDFSIPSVIFLSEWVKLGLSFNMYANQVGYVKAISRIYETQGVWWAYYAVPSGAYMLTNNLNVYAAQYMDAASQGVLSQMKVLTTSVIWFLVFKKLITRIQVLALVVLTLGAMASALPAGTLLGIGDATSTGNTQMYVEYIGFICLLFTCCVSGLVGCYTEWLYKRVGQCESFYLQNIYMYSEGVLFNFGLFTYTNGAAGMSGMLDGWNRWAVCLLLVYAFMGLVMGVVMKYFTNIHRLFMTGASVYFCVITNLTVFQLEFTLEFMVSVCMVTVALALYNWTDVQEFFKCFRRKAQPDKSERQLELSPSPESLIGNGAHENKDTPS